MSDIVPTEADLAIAQEIVSFVRGFGVKIGRGHVAVQLIARHAATARKEALEEAAKIAEDHAAGCLQARGNAGAQMDRYGVWQAEAERLASLSIASAIRQSIERGAQ